MEKTIYLDVEGRQELLKYLKDFQIKGTVADIKVRRYDQGSGVVTYGLKLHGYTGGNFDIEIPLHFNEETGKVSKPVIGYVYGQAVLLSASTFDNLLSSANLSKKYSPGWMSVEKVTHPSVGWVFNLENKYASISEADKCLSDFYIVGSGSPEQVRDALRRARVRNANIEEGDLYLAFGARLSYSTIQRLAQEPIDEFEIHPEEEVSRELAPEEEFYTEWEPEEEEAAPEEEPLIIVPEEYKKIVFPTVGELLELVRLYKTIKFVYKKLNDEWVFRTAEPHYVWKTKKGNLLVIAWDLYRNDWRSFDINRIRDVEIYYDRDWMELGQFIAMIENLKKNRQEHLLWVDIFNPRGPYHKQISDIRGSLKSMKAGGPLKSLIGKMVCKLDLLLEAANG